jgi:hypothetical protein
MVSVNRLRTRKRDLPINHWIMDSGAFTELATYGAYREEPGAYAEQVNRWQRCGDLRAAVSQDYMCEPFMLERTGMSVEEHQQLTIDRYRQIKALCPASYIMPVLQGYRPQQYVDHLLQYGKLLRHGAWVGVGSVCKRNRFAGSVEDVLLAIQSVRPDLRLHGFGVKLTALQSPYIRKALHSADSMAWSYSARKQGRDGNDMREAAAFSAKIDAWQADQHHLFG